MMIYHINIILGMRDDHAVKPNASASLALRLSDEMVSTADGKPKNIFSVRLLKIQ